MRFMTRGKIYPLPGGLQWEAIDEPTAFSTVLPITVHGTFVLMEQYRFPAERRMLLLAGGASETGESLEETARRELLEESGYMAGPLELLIEGFVLHATRNTQRTNIYVSRECERTQEPAPDPVERIAGLRPLEFSIRAIKTLLARGDPSIDTTLFAALAVLMARGEI